MPRRGWIFLQGTVYQPEPKLLQYLDIFDHIQLDNLQISNNLFLLFEYSFYLVGGSEHTFAQILHFAFWD